MIWNNGGPKINRVYQMIIWIIAACCALLKIEFYIGFMCSLMFLIPLPCTVVIICYFCRKTRNIAAVRLGIASLWNVLKWNMAQRKLKWKLLKRVDLLWRSPTMLKNRIMQRTSALTQSIEVYLMIHPHKSHRLTLHIEAVYQQLMKRSCRCLVSRYAYIFW